MKQRSLLAAFLLLTNIFSFAQNDTVEMADSMRSNGKIYVVVAVILTIFAGIILYLIRLDRKISKLERNDRVNH
jgi:uncharacterized membrane protein